MRGRDAELGEQSFSLPRIIAHRGGAAEAPENTLVAFVEARNAGATMIECDFTLTRDQKVVLFHDESLERTTNGSGAVRARSLSELESLDAGYSFVDENGSHCFRDRGVQIPRLDDAIAFDDTMSWILELKPSSLVAARLALNIVRAAGALGRVVFASRHESILRNLRKEEPAMLLAPGPAGVRKALMRAHLRLRPIETYAMFSLPPKAFGISLTHPRFVSHLAASRTPLAMWTINDWQRAESLFRAGIEAVITDTPAKFLNNSEIKM